VEAPVSKPGPAAGDSRFGADRGVGGNARDAQPGEQRIGSILEPARVPRFACDRRGTVARKSSEERGRHCRIEVQLRRKLNKEDGQLVAEQPHLCREIIERFGNVDQLALMSNFLRQLDREAEAARNAVPPALPRRGPVRPMERAVDLGRS
jgi:hypothetical protein